VSLQYLKPGDKVFVVWQGRWQKDLRTEHATVVKVGRKYGYLDRDKAFDLVSGESHHGTNDISSRMNGFGFDVYATEAEYRQKTKRVERFRELAERLGFHVTSLRALDPEAVEAIHEILDGDAK